MTSQTSKPSQHQKLLLTNDDGYDAPGLAALEHAVAGWGMECVVVAPDVCHSGGGHRVTTHRPLVVQTVGPGRFGIDGTPADCTRLALSTLCPDPTWVLSGINAGGNLEALQRLYRFGVGINDVNEALVNAHLKVLA